MKASVISLSGGLDSTALMLHMLSQGYRVYAVSFLYGQRHKIEVDRACKNIRYLHDKGCKDQLIHKIIDLSSPMSLLSSDLIGESSNIPRGYYEEETMKSTVVPNRNAIFSSILFGYALSIANTTNDSVTLSLGVHSGDHAIYPDCRPDFYNSLYDAFTKGNWESERVEFYMPYIHLDKASILRDARKRVADMGLSFSEIFRNTITSYSPNNNGVSDGTTGSDIERILAFHEIDEVDPIPYTKPWEEVLSHAIKIQKEYLNSNQ